MKKAKVLALILAGGKGGRLGALTKNRAKPVMPFAGSYRLIDFALSNCRHSEISDVWIIEQYQLHSLNEHLSNGRPWDLDRTYGGLQVLPPLETAAEDDSEGGFATGNADAIYRHRNFISQFNPDVLLVLSADHIYKLDFRDVIETHFKNQAHVTMVTTKVPDGESAARFGTVKVDETGRVTDFQYKPEQPESDLITTEVFVYDARLLLETLDELAADSNGESLEDFGDKLIPKLVADGKAFEFRFENYWLDVGTITAYYRAHIDLLENKTNLILDDPNWAILTLGSQRVPAMIGKTARVGESLISNGCKILGSVARSVLAPGVSVAENAEVIDSIVLPDARIESGALVSKAIVDSGVTVRKGDAGELDEQSGIVIFAQTAAAASDSESARVAVKQSS